MLSPRWLFLSLLLACASRTQPPETWRIDLTTSGGITGRGTGSLSITHDGEVMVTSMAGERCRFGATDEELSRMTSAVAALAPAPPRRSFAPPDRCCDRIDYTLKVDRDGAQTTIDWIDDPLPMPADVQVLVDAVNALRRAHGGRC